MDFLISDASRITDNEEKLEQTLPQSVPRCHRYYSHKEFGIGLQVTMQASTDTWSSHSHSIMENSLTLETGTNLHSRQHTGHPWRMDLHQEKLRSLCGIFWRLTAGGGGGDGVNHPSKPFPNPNRGDCLVFLVLWRPNDLVPPFCS